MLKEAIGKGLTWLIVVAFMTSLLSVVIGAMEGLLSMEYALGKIEKEEICNGESLLGRYNFPYRVACEITRPRY